MIIVLAFKRVQLGHPTRVQCLGIAALSEKLPQIKLEFLVANKE